MTLVVSKMAGWIYFPVSPISSQSTISVTLENFGKTDVFRGYRNEHWPKMG